MTLPYKGVDYSAGAGTWSATKINRFAAALAADKRAFAVRYLDRPGHYPSNKQLTLAEFKALQANGVHVCICLEDDIDTWKGGASVGKTHAQRAKSELVKLGIPETQPIYYAVDTGAYNWSAMAAYFTAIATEFDGSVDSIGVYGGLQVVKWAIANKKAKYYFQAQAWSTVYPGTTNEYYGLKNPPRVLYWHPQSHIRQHGENQTTVVIDGTNCNADSCHFEDYGQYPRPGVIPSPIPVPIPKPELKLGSSGPYVKFLQSALNRAGYTPILKVDGEFGPKTLAAVKWFQAKMKIKVDGVVGNITWSFIEKV